MQVETEIEVKYRTTLGDNFSDDTDEVDIESAVQEHIKEYCEEHGISTADVEIISQNKE